MILASYHPAQRQKPQVVDYRKPVGSRTDYKDRQANVFTVAEAREEAWKFPNAVERGIGLTAPCRQM
jgi:hypothetical protein